MGILRFYLVSCIMFFSTFILTSNVYAIDLKSILSSKNEVSSITWKKFEKSKTYLNKDWQDYEANENDKINILKIYPIVFNKIELVLMLAKTEIDSYFIFTNNKFENFKSCRETLSELEKNYGKAKVTKDISDLAVLDLSKQWIIGDSFVEAVCLGTREDSGANEFSKFMIRFEDKKNKKLMNHLQELSCDDNKIIFYIDTDKENIYNERFSLMENKQVTISNSKIMFKGFWLLNDPKNKKQKITVDVVFDKKIRKAIITFDDELTYTSKCRLNDV